MLQDLTFTFQNGLYIAEAEVNNDFCVHVECGVLSNIKIYQRTCGDDFVETARYEMNRTIDDDFQGIVWPKTIRVSSNNNPILAKIKEAS